MGHSNPIYCKFPLSIISSWLAPPVISPCVLPFPFAGLIDPDNSFRLIQWDKRRDTGSSPHPRDWWTRRGKTNQLIKSVSLSFSPTLLNRLFSLPSILHIDNSWTVILNKADSCSIKSADVDVLSVGVQVWSGIYSVFLTVQTSLVGPPCQALRRPTRLWNELNQICVWGKESYHRLTPGLD